MAEGITGWRLHVGVIFPTPVPPRAVLEFYEAVPEGVDMTTVSLTIRQLSDDDMDEAIKGMERAAKQLASFDVDLIYQSGVPPFEQFINDRLIQYLAAQKIEITSNAALGIKRNVEIRRLPIPVEYTVARKTYLAATTKPDGIYIPCGGWGSIHNIELLEKDLDTTVVTWLNAMIWSSLRRGKVAGAIHGFGKLLASL